MGSAEFAEAMRPYLAEAYGAAREFFQAETSERLERIERLERAVLRSWEGDTSCGVCDAVLGQPHAPRCIVPSLLRG